MTLAEIIAKLKDAQAAVNAFKQQVDGLVESVVDAPQQPAPVTGDSPTEKVPAVNVINTYTPPPQASDLYYQDTGGGKVPAVTLPPPQTYSGEHSA